MTSPAMHTQTNKVTRDYLKKIGFLHNSDAQAEATAYMQGRKDGTIRSIHTPWHRFNQAILDGIDWGSMVTIAGRPASGKTLAAAMISRRAFELNPDQDFAVLDMQFEMHARHIVLREISANMRRSIRYLANAECGNKLLDTDIQAAVDFCKRNQHNDIFFYEQPLTVDGMVGKIIEFARLVRKPVIVTIDHSLLVQRGSGERSQLETLTNLATALSRLRKEPGIKIIIILLSQLNRDIESNERMVNGSVGNYVKDSDLFGADAVLQNSDIVFAMHRPGKYGLTHFGVENYIINPDIIIGQFLKVRVGSPEIQFYKADFANSNLFDIGAPPTQPRQTGGSRFTP